MDMVETFGPGTNAARRVRAWLTPKVEVMLLFTATKFEQIALLIDAAIVILIVYWSLIVTLASLQTFGITVSGSSNQQATYQQTTLALAHVIIWSVILSLAGSVIIGLAVHRFRDRPLVKYATLFVAQRWSRGSQLYT